ncbi:MAG: hypothetical protein JWQ11_3662 [Rhizobacter sp.]|nr:hypothetical protein [Rhizobacter sp.]
MKIGLSLAAALALLALHQQASCAEPKIGATLIPGVFEADKSGDYDKAMAALRTASGLALEVLSQPPARVEEDLRQHKIDCMVPFDVRFWTGSEKLVNSEPVNVAKIFIFTKAGDGPYTSLEPLKGKRVGGRRGLNYGPKVDAAGMKLDPVNEDDQNVQKLDSGRIDAFLAYVPDMWIWAAEKKRQLPNHDAAHPFEVHNDALLCHDTPETRAFLKTFDAAVVKLRASGEMKKLLGASYVP